MLIIFLMSLIYKAKLTLGCHYYSDRADALTDDEETELRETMSDTFDRLCFVTIREV